MSMRTYISGYSVIVTNHAQERIIERFKALSIAYPHDEDYLELALCAVTKTLSNSFLYRYISNAMHCYRPNIDVLVYDVPNKMVYAVAIKPYDSTIVIKTIGTTYQDEEWMYYNKKHQRICWIYENVFKFSTNNGNITWF